MESPSDIRRTTEDVAAGARLPTLNRPYAFAMASVSALFLALVGLLGQLVARELSVLPALFLRYLASAVVILIVLRSDALQTLKAIGRLDWLRVASVLISQFCLFLLSRAWIAADRNAALQYRPTLQPDSGTFAPWDYLRDSDSRESATGICRCSHGAKSLWRNPR